MEIRAVPIWGSLQLGFECSPNHSLHSRGRFYPQAQCDSGSASYRLMKSDDTAREDHHFGLTLATETHLT